VVPEPYRPVLRGLLVTGAGSRGLRRDAPLESMDGAPWPSQKLAARELAPYLADHPEFLVGT
jgi:hypothetical protein